MPKETAYRLMIAETDIEFKKHDMLYMLENPNRPGPDYYKDCKMYDWKTNLIDSHRLYIEGKGEDYEYYTLSAEDEKWRKKTLDATYLSIKLCATAGILVSMY